VGFSYAPPPGVKGTAPSWGWLLRDPAILGILASNLAALGVALWQQWPIALLLWPYWLQSLVIGGFARRRILALKRFSTAGFQIDNRNVAPTDATKRMTANFFAMHYGGFHAIYLVFLIVFSLADVFGPPPTVSDAGWIALLGLGFLLSHWGSQRRHLAADLRNKRNIGSMMFLPYARIVPMHLIIIFGGILGGGALALALFSGLKTVADIAMHVVEHRWLQTSTPD
jgi:hypothetical protein